MFIFFAGLQGGEKLHKNLLHLIVNRLISYHYTSSRLDKFYITERPLDSKIEKLIMDSGAFSAWNQNIQIDFDSYVNYCLKHEDRLDYIVNLDVIPAIPGQKIITQKEIEQSASLGYKNARKMLAAGIPREKLIHVFHQNENFKWLKRMVRDFPYIGLSPANDTTTAQKKQWLDQCMPYVTDQDGFPIVKFHGFAVTAHILIVRYPWFSVDSSTWCQEAGRGMVYIPPYKDGKYSYDVPPIRLRIGFNSLIERDKIHFFNRSPLQKEIIVKYFTHKGYDLGSSTCDKRTQGMKKGHKAPIRFCRKKNKCDHIFPELGCLEKVSKIGIINNHYVRAELNVIYLQDLQNSMPSWPNKRYAYLRKTQGFGL